MNATPEASKRPARRFHALSIWSAIASVLAAGSYLAFACLMRVVRCPLKQDDLISNLTCDFRPGGSVLILAALVLALIALLFAAEHDPQLDMQNLAGLQRKIARPHRVAFAAWRALQAKETPHRKKTIANTLGWMLLALVFAYIVGVAKVSF